jgi:hypothetical protein
MTDKVMKKKEFLKYLEDWGRILGLESWHIKVQFEVPPEDESTGTQTFMQMERHDTYNSAVLTVHPCVIGKAKWGNWIESVGGRGFYVRKSVKHELLHLAIRDLVFVPVSVEVMLGTLMNTPFQAWATNAEEQFVDRLAVSLTEAFG